jgi:hypothetical protein
MPELLGTVQIEESRGLIEKYQPEYSIKQSLIAPLDSHQAHYVCVRLSHQS